MHWRLLQPERLMAAAQPPNLLAQLAQALQAQANQPAVGAAPQAGPNFIDKPTLPPTSRYIRTGSYPSGVYTPLLPGDSIGAQGQPYLLDLPQDRVYEHALIKGRHHQAGVYRQTTATCAYNELVTAALGVTAYLN